MKIDKVVTVQVENVPEVEVEVTLLKSIPHKFLLIGFFGGLVDSEFSIGKEVLWNSAQKQPCLTFNGVRRKKNRYR